MSNSEDPPRSITAASLEVMCSVSWLRKCVNRGQIKAERLPNRNIIFRNKDIQQAKELLYGTNADCFITAAKSLKKKSSKKRRNGR
jgi:hypothetical protein